MGIDTRMLGRAAVRAEGRARVALLAWAALLSVLTAYAAGWFIKWADITDPDTLSWRLFASAALDHAPRPERSEYTVLLISDAYFEGAFRQRSPLDRGELARLLGKVAKGVERQRQHVVAIDLDLSPAPDADERERQAQHTLDKAIIELARKAHVVLLCPFARTENLRELQKDWMVRLLQALRTDPEAKAPFGLQFARSDLQIQSGGVYHYGSDAPTLGVRAGQALAAAPGTQDPFVAADICADAEHRGRSDPLRELRKVNFTGYATLHRIAVDATTPVAELLRHQAPRLVFVGGAYALGGDAYTAAMGEEVPGAVQHAAVAYSVRHPVGDAEKLYSVLLQWGVNLIILLIGAYVATPLLSKLDPTASAALSYPAWLDRAYRDLWGKEPDHPPRQMEAWLRGLMAWLIHGAVFVVYVVALGLVSVALFVASSIWFEFLLTAASAFLNAIAKQRKPQAAASPPEQDTATRRNAQGGGVPGDERASSLRGDHVWPAIVLLRGAILLFGAGVVSAKFFE
ncbi:MAG: hypothetical protein BroJett031_23640 [Betaproteobacteria bacterium]|nr:MAG: hypothetical protein BroJett031_23640 [Betaproteobacteria bacterium]